MLIVFFIFISPITGRKRILKRETPFCVEIERYTPNLSEYGFVVLTGKLKLVENPQERKTAIDKMSEVGKEKLSKNFLLAHGFSKGSDWTDFFAKHAR
jgi:nitroimidazol reductase NimA-like FMN-containing flavoprotein (pyridoxamine 5'-phosphate oxidase superfamily)